MKPRCKQQVRRLLDVVAHPPSAHPITLAWQGGGPYLDSPIPPTHTERLTPLIPRLLCDGLIEAECCQIYNRLPSLAGGRTASTSETDSCTSKVFVRPSQARPSGFRSGNLRHPRPWPHEPIIPALGARLGGWCIDSDPPQALNLPPLLRIPGPRACLDSWTDSLENNSGLQRDAGKIQNKPESRISSKSQQQESAEPGELVPRVCLVGFG